jgi:hypothetical protein
MSDRQTDEYAVGAWPQYFEDVGEPPLIGYATHQSLGAALDVVGRLVEAWEASDWPEDVLDPPEVIGFEFVVSRPGWPDPDINY